MTNTDTKQAALARVQLMDEISEVLKRHYTTLPHPVRYNAALAALQVAELHRKEQAS